MCFFAQKYILGEIGMKNRKYITRVTLLATFAVLALVPAMAQTNTVSPYWTGDGGRGSSITILAPRASGLAENQGYLPSFVQGEFVSNFSTFSAISVLDRERLDERYAELFSGYYDDEAVELSDLGHLSPTDYLMGGSIIRTPTGYALQMTITRNADKMTVASYSGTSSFIEIDNLVAIRKASLDLLEKMGVLPTDRARTELARAATQDHADAQTALAMGIMAQRQGTMVEALSYYFQAATLDSTLLEAAGRSSVLSANITSGNIGADVRNDIAWRNAWVKQLRETEEFFYKMLGEADPPYTLFYSTALEQGNVNYQAETVDLSFPVNLRARGVWFNTVAGSLERVAQAVYDGLNATGRTKEWNLANWPRTGVSSTNPFNRQWGHDVTVAFELVNEQGRVIGRNSERNSWSYRVYLGGNDRIVTEFDRDTFSTKQFRAVNANDISTNLTIRIASVNGAAPDSAHFSITALTGSKFAEYRNALNYLRVENGVVRGFASSSPQTTLRFPAEIWSETDYGITAIGNGAFENKNLSSIEIPNSVTYIGASAFASNKLTEVTIPNVVTFIGDRAFYNNQIANITIPNSVNTIGREAFIEQSISSITIGSKVRIRADAFAKEFLDFYYNKNNRSAGIYTMSYTFDARRKWDFKEQ